MRSLGQWKDMEAVESSSRRLKGKDEKAGL
jgi:hypothetical protein